jgi:hypothetical protein
MNHIDDTLPIELMKQTIGIGIKVLSNNYKDLPATEKNEYSCYQEIIFQIEDEDIDDPDVFAIGILFCLSLMSFTYAAPRGYSEVEFIPDEQWSLGYFLQGLDFDNGQLVYYGDYVSGRMMKTEIVYQSGGKVTLRTTNRGKSSERWLMHLQGKKHITEVK